MLNGWLPATLERPKTVCTFRALELFHMLSHRGKVTAYDYYVSLEKITDNIGGKGFTVSLPLISFAPVRSIPQ